MRPRPSLPPEFLGALRRQDGVITREQALGAGLTKAQLRTLADNGWRCLIRGVLIDPQARDPMRASIRAALLACPRGTLASVTAGRIHGLWGLTPWTSLESPCLLLPAGQTYSARRGVILRSGLLPHERTHWRGFPITTMARTVHDLSAVLASDDLVCAVDSALRLGWRPALPSGTRRKLCQAVALADARSESTLETLLRLLLVRANLAPETLQHELRDESGEVYARLDMAWPSVKLALEADGRAYHDAPHALYRDRARANQLQLAGWTVLRFTWHDVVRRPDWVSTQVRDALNRLSAVKSAG